MSPDKVLPWVFFLSGLSSLVFQVAWQRLLTVWYGVGPISMTLIVTVYMLGLGLGGFIGGILADRLDRGRILLYVLVEASLALFGFLSLPYLNWLGSHTAGADVSVALLCMALFLLLPTLAMGMTLPLIVKIFSEHDNNFLRSVAYLYSLNTLGAFTGALISSYLIISFFGIDGAIYIASGIDLLLAAAIFACRAPATSSKADDTALPDTPPATVSAPCPPVNEAPSHLPGDRLPLLQAEVFVTATGFLAIGYEIVWFRLITLIIKPSAYTFSTVLAIYLLGLFIGSAIVNVLSSSGRIKNARSLFCWLQVGTAVSVLISIAGFFHLFRHVPLFTAITLGSFSWNSPIFKPVDIIFWPVFFQLIPCILMGASFPLITYLGRTNQQHHGRTVGTLYLFNTIGNVLGGAVTGYLLLPVLGTETTLLVFILCGMLFLIPASTPRPIVRHSLLAGLCCLALLFMPSKGVLYSNLFDTLIRNDAVLGGSGFKLYVEEGVDGVIATSVSDQYIQNFINGLTHGRRPDYKYYREAIEAMAYHPQAKHALVIGFGTGSTVEALERMPTIEKITLVELNKTNLVNLRKIDEIRKILEDKRLEIIVDDARRYLLTTKDRYDLITMDPLRPTEAYSNNIYSREFFSLLQKHLTEKGLVMAWLGEHRIVPKTIESVFPHVRVYNFFMLAADTPLEKYPQRESEAFSKFSKAELAYLQAFPTKFLYDRESLNKEADFQRYPVNEDAKPNAEYYLGVMSKHKGWSELAF